MRKGRKSTLVGWHLAPKSGRRSRSKSPSKRPPKAPKKEMKFLYEVGVLGSSLSSMDIHGINGLHSARLSATSRGSPIEYTKLVRKTFAKNEKVYKKFVNILSEVQVEGASKLNIIKRVVLLFDGYPDLILGFNAFLPEEYLIELQDDAVVVKVYENAETLEDIDTGHFRYENQFPATLDLTKSGSSSMDGTLTSRLTGQSLQYARSVKEMFKEKPHIYKRFSEILGDYHSRSVDVINTMYEIVGLLQQYPDLVLGFNTFLPAGYSVHMYEKSGYIVEYPGSEEGTREYSKILIEDAPDKKKKKGNITFRD